MFLQIHTLTSYHASLLNRDDAGLAKRMPFGEAVRLRVSSQCLKRHWREALQKSLSLPQGIRSRRFFEREVLPRVLAGGVAESAARPLIRAMVERLIDGGLEEGSESLELKQPILFGKPEADFLVGLVVECAKAKEPTKTLQERLKVDKLNFRALLRQAGHGDLFAGLEGALFGRFVTSDILSRTDASVHVAHAISVHALDTEIDYFTVVDDLNREEETGAAHANDMELGAGLFYGYVVVDVPLLVSNLCGCAPADWRAQDLRDARQVLQQLIRVIATVSPGAKRGATAPYAYSDFVLLEAGRQQPRSLANAYLRALPLGGDALQTAANACAAHLEALERMYGPTAEARFAASTRSLPAGLGEAGTVEAISKRALDVVFGG